MGISEQQLLDACSAQSVQSEHLHVFEPVLAADDFELFKGLMVRKNIELELQALMHLQEQKGVIPECMSVDGLDKAGELDREEMQLLQEAIRASKQQYEMEQRWRRSCILEPGTTEEQEDEEPCREGRPLLQGSIHHQVSECCADVPGPSGRRCSDVADEPPGATGPSQHQAAGASSAPAARQDVPSVPGGSQATQPPPHQLPSEPPGGMSADAVAQQRQQQQPRASQPNGAAPPGKAQASKLHETRPKEAAVSLKHNLSAEELRSREEYLRQQRDRLLAAKREQLGSSQRQASAFSNDRKAPGPGRADACTAGGCGGDGDAPRRGPSATGGAVADRPAPAATATGKQGARTEESQTLEQRKRVAHKLKEELLQKK
ncbi:cilia- and flagella-associated protein 36-like isoform X2 [Lethenteron reissneri]|uniref:cilia- and flagella-associated protein 36-like isoform X2 n=1 Tax=Lethenteron reissneri TaxID=7753 RepID=UPI002AB7DB04|nr:cilia- and flagella-associated protein 36-like isoform X2 [Lethenteron reissneri]